MTGAFSSDRWTPADNDAFLEFERKLAGLDTLELNAIIDDCIDEASEFVTIGSPAFPPGKTVIGIRAPFRDHTPENECIWIRASICMQKAISATRQLGMPKQTGVRRIFDRLVPACRPA
jgi:hypothetical protein